MKMFVSSGGFRVISLNQTVEVEEGNNATLQCHVQPTVNMENYTVEVRRADIVRDPKSVVYAFRHKVENLHYQLDQYRNRTFFNFYDLNKGILTLWISSVQISDSGQYKFYIPKLKESYIIHLTVGKHAEFINVQINLGFVYLKMSLMKLQIMKNFVSLLFASII